MESLKINVDSAVDGNVEYRAFIQEVGWTDWKSNGAEVGTTGQSKRLEASAGTFDRKTGRTV